MVEPLVSRLVLGGDGHGTAMLRSAATTDQQTTVTVPGTGPARVEVYDGRGRLRATSRVRTGGARARARWSREVHRRPPVRMTQ